MKFEIISTYFFAPSQSFNVVIKEHIFLGLNGAFAQTKLLIDSTS